ncbi:hypothetical protein ACFL17_10490 [Pseudomonadota bacterium]
MNQTVLDLLKSESDFYDSNVHGVYHWNTVARNGQYLADFTGADKAVVKYFGYFHDCMRISEDSDPEHGLRGAQFAQKHRHLIDLDDAQFKKLLTACRSHTVGEKTSCVTVATCWDADRLDLPRVGIEPDPERLFSEEATRIATFRDFAVLRPKRPEVEVRES